MAKQVMRRRAEENTYLHRDFHGALSAGIEYLHEHYGEDAVRAYLWQFARAFYAPLTEALQQRGLAAVEEHYRRVYDLEGGDVRFQRTRNMLTIEVQACPAVTHMRTRGYTVARLFRETLETVAKAICQGTDFDAELRQYDQQDGHSVLCFYRSVP